MWYAASYIRHWSKPKALVTYRGMIASVGVDAVLLVGSNVIRWWRPTNDLLVVYAILQCHTQSNE
jgi:hypothetical protein